MSNETVYRPLAPTWDKFGFTFTQVSRIDDVVIAEQADADTGSFIAYEIFEVQKFEEGFVGPQKYFQPAREVPPNTESWGIKGFTTYSFERAQEIQKVLLERIKNRESNKEKEVEQPAPLKAANKADKKKKK